MLVTVEDTEPAEALCESADEEVPPNNPKTSSEHAVLITTGTPAKNSIITRDILMRALRTYLS